MIKIHILNEGKSFKPTQVIKILGAFNKAVRTCRKLISADTIDMVVLYNPARVMTETGIGGKTYTTNYVDVTINAKVNFDPEKLYLAMCHEMHHATRQRKFGFPQTLFDVIVSEGLADQFEVEINPKRKLSTHKNIDKKILLKGLDELKKQINSKNYDYYGWFFGANNKYPKYFGYILGSMIVGAYLKKHKTRPSKSVIKPTKSFIPYIDIVRRSIK
jgi:uncharacterized protein YjaZ